MTTRLAGPTTEFLPFNQGHNGHAGNPPATGGKHATAYLWEQVWQRDAFLDLLGRFVHTEVDDAGKATGKVIFPRFHQWDCVLRLEAEARANGPGHRYLAQHSAGSGKSNSIAWLAHRLSKLHDDHDKAVFDKVIVITDRRVLDDQLSATVAQFESVAGVVVRVEDKEGAKSTKLAEALLGEQARIVVCTLQTFSFVLDKIEGIGRRNYAVIVDEAHSSQTGEAARDLKAALGAGSEEARLEIAEKDEAGEVATAEDKLNEAVAARAHQENLSFFAFTATPKARTVELFGTTVPGRRPQGSLPHVLDAPGDRGRLHPRRPAPLHALRRLLAGEAGRRERSRGREGQGVGADREGHLAASAQPGPAGQARRRPLPRARRPPDRRQREGDGRDSESPSCGAVQAVDRSLPG